MTPKKTKKTTGKSPRARKAPKSRPENATSLSESRLLKLRKEDHPIRAIVKASARLADIITDEDRERAKEVIRQAMDAEHRIFDPATREMIVVADHKIRLAATTLFLAYVEGTPVRREVSVTANFEPLDSVLERLKESPEARRMLSSMGMNLDVQKSGV
jgi:hypothetical protein